MKDGALASSGCERQHLKLATHMEEGGGVMAPTQRIIDLGFGAWYDWGKTVCSSGRRPSW